MSLNNSHEIPLVPLSAFQFHINDLEVSVNFSSNRSQVIDSLTLIQCGEEILMNKLVDGLDKEVI